MSTTDPKTDSTATKAVEGTPAAPGAAAPAAVEEEKRPWFAVYMPIGDSFKKIREQLSQDKAFSPEEFSSGPELATMLTTVPVALVVFHLFKTDHVVKHVTILKTFQDAIKAGRVKPVLIHGRIPDDIINVYQKYGCREFVKEPVTFKSISFKFKKILSTLEAKLKKRDSKEIELKRGQANNKNASYGDNEKKKAAFKWIDTPNFESDCWLFDALDPRWVMGKWMVRVRGPSPSIGKWIFVEEKEKRKSDQLLWRWEFRDPAEGNQFTKVAGSWFMRGRKPDFIGEQWVFVSSLLEMRFLDAEQKVLFSKVTTTKGNDIEVAKDTPYAKSLTEAIIESMNKVLKDRTKKNPEEEAALKKLAMEERAKKIAEMPKLFEGDPKALVAFGFVLSELMRLPNLEIKDVCDRIFSFVDKEMQGKRVEFWVKKSADAKWAPVGSSDRKACEAYFAMDHLDQPVKIFEDTTLVSKIELNADHCEGALVIRGNKLQEIPQKFIADFTYLFKGLFLSLVPQAGTQVEGAAAAAPQPPASTAA